MTSDVLTVRKKLFAVLKKWINLDRFGQHGLEDTWLQIHAVSFCDLNKEVPCEVAIPYS